MTIHHTRIFQTLILMICVCASMHAALNFVHNDTSVDNTTVAPHNINTALAPSKPASPLATQVELPAIHTPMPQIPENNNHTSISAPNTDIDDDDATIEFYFEDASLENLLNQIASLYDVVFISEDAVTPLPEGKKTLKGNKISFKTHKPLTRRAAWNLFLTFLEIAEFTLTTESKPNIYRVVQLAPMNTAVKSPIPSYIGTKPSQLPTNDQMIRYVYFVQNTNVDTIFDIVNSLRSNVSALVKLTDMQAFLITDKAYNIASLMEIVTELDRVTMPQSMSVLKLKRADAEEVKKLYEALTGKKDNEAAASRLFPARKSPTAVYFPENLRIIAYPRTNALILLGSEDAIKKIEDFVLEHVDVDVTAPYPPFRVHNLRYADATAIADIMNGLTQFGQTTEAGKYGGVRGEDKYVKKMTFTAEKTSNRLIIQGDEEDYLMAKEILDKLDEPQPQVAIEVLLLSVGVVDNEQLGVQLRSKINNVGQSAAASGASGLLGDTVKFQTSGLYGSAGIQTVASPPAQGANILLANLINLAVGAPVGNTLVSLGSDINGVWGLLQALQTVTNTQIIATPFLVATNKTPAVVTIGQTRRVTVATVVATTTQNSNDDKAANLEVAVTPTINSDGMISLDLQITVNQFAEPTNYTNATVNTKKLVTQTVVSNGEVLALGGLIQNNIISNLSQTPILGKIPILGWLFKNRQDSQQKNNLLVLICPRILPPESSNEADKFTRERILGYHSTLADMLTPVSGKDPVEKFFFDQKKDSVDKTMEDYIFNRHKIDIPMRHEKPQLEKNQHARKRASRNKFKKTPKEQDEAIPPVSQENPEPMRTEVAALTSDVTKAPTNKPIESAPAPSSPRSARRTRRSLSTFISDTESEGVIS